MRNRQRQRGLTMTGFIFTAIVVVSVVMIGFRIMPSYIEYFSVQKVLAKTLEDSKQGFTLYQFRRDFDLKAQRRLYRFGSRAATSRWPRTATISWLRRRGPERCISSAT